jgi:hypothetical protein
VFFYTSLTFYSWFVFQYVYELLFLFFLLLEYLSLKADAKVVKFLLLPRLFFKKIKTFFNPPFFKQYLYELMPLFPKASAKVRIFFYAARKFYRFSIRIDVFKKMNDEQISECEILCINSFNKFFIIKEDFFYCSHVFYKKVKNFWPLFCII